jgi:hypothetical protein
MPAVDTDSRAPIQPALDKVAGDNSVVVSADG